MFIRSVLVLVALAGCYDEQSIELDVKRDDPSNNFQVKVCREDGTACKPNDNSVIFTGSGATTEVHIVVDDSLPSVELKLRGTVGGPTSCGIVTIQSSVIHYAIEVDDTGVMWECDAPECELLPAGDCEF